MIAHSGSRGETEVTFSLGRVRQWKFWALPGPARAYFLTVEMLALVLAIATFIYLPITRTDLIRFAVLAVLALGYAEAAGRIDRFKRFLGHEGIWADHASVWAIAGVLVLHTGYDVLLVLLVYAQQLLSAYRHGSAPLHRVLFITATMVLATLAAARFLDLTGGGLLSSGVLAALATVAALIIFPLVNLGTLLGGKALATGARVTELLPDRESVAFELMTLVLGVLTASLLLHTPWLTPLALVLLAGLHRSSLVKGLQDAANTDSKTGLLNLAAWQERAGESLKRAARAQQPVAALLIDLDHFKRVNDTHGHLVGDRVLHLVAALFVDEVRGHDLVGRFGGEEFVVFMAGPSPAEAMEIAQRLCRRVSSLATVEIPGVTVSIGLAQCADARKTTVEQLLQAADTALYAAKSGGRNRVEIADVTAEPTTVDGAESLEAPSLGPQGRSLGEQLVDGSGHLEMIDFQLPQIVGDLGDGLGVSDAAVGTQLPRSVQENVDGLQRLAHG